MSPQAVYHRDSWDARAADGVHLTPSVRLLATPGHTSQDLSVLVGTLEQVVVLTHLWWTDQGPLEDPYAPDPDALRAQRERILALPDLVIPGHGPAFIPAPARPAKRTRRQIRWACTRQYRLVSASSSTLAAFV